MSASFTQALLGFALALAVTMALMPLLIRWALPLRILDMPAARKVHAQPIPRVGGIAMGGGVVAAMMLWGSSTPPMQALLLGNCVLLCFGIWDDRSDLGAGPKFAGQALAAVVAMAWGGVMIASLTLLDRSLLPGWIALPLTFLFLLGSTNAFNLTDGLDGLAGGMAVLCFCGTALLAFTVGDTAVGSAAVFMIGAVVGFLRFNTHPARVFMGDGGSQLLGFSAAVLAILLTQDPRTPLSTALPLLLLGMPIIDTLTVMTERLVARQSPFKADRRHVHHRLLALGFSHREAVILLYLLQGLLFVAAWLLRFEPDLWVILAFAVLALLVLVPLYAAQRLGLRLRRATPDGRPLRAQPVGPGVSRPRSSAAGLALKIALACYAAWVLLYGARPSTDLRWFALVLGGLLAAEVAWRRQWRTARWLGKLALYSGATLAVYLCKQATPDTLRPAWGELLIFPLIALAVIASFRSSPDRVIRLTPLDILVVLVVLTVPNLPDSVIKGQAAGLTVAELLSLYYALEVLSVASAGSQRRLHGAAAVFLLVLAARPMA